MNPINTSLAGTAVAPRSPRLPPRSPNLPPRFSPRDGRKAQTHQPPYYRAESGQLTGFVWENKIKHEKQKRQVEKENSEMKKKGKRCSIM